MSIRGKGGDLALISDQWAGWRLVRHRLYSPEGVEWTVGTLNAWAFERQLLEELMRGRLAANDAHV